MENHEAPPLMWRLLHELDGEQVHLKLCREHQLVDIHGELVLHYGEDEASVKAYDGLVVTFPTEACIDLVAKNSDEIVVTLMTMEEEV